MERSMEVSARTGTLTSEWRPSKAGAFVKETMNDLADLGEKMGADAGSWISEPPAQ